METLINEDTQLIQEDIPTVFQHLFENYGQVLTEEVKEREKETREMMFHSADPLIILYEPIKKLGKLAVMAEIN